LADTKKCPFCAEDIQSAAVVCKHCGRDLVGGASQVQLVQPKKKTSLAAWGCLTLILLFVVFAIIGQCSRPSTPSRSATSSPATSSSPQAQPAANQPAPAGRTSPAPPPPVTDKWVRAETTSQMDDSKGVVFQLEGESEIEGWLHRQRPSLVLRCHEGKAEAYMVTGMPASVESGEFHRHTVSVRFDENRTQSQMWGQSTDDKALFAPQPVSFIKGVAGAKRLRLQFTPFNASPVIAEFDVTGFGKYIGDIAKACRWK
jgi:hypothetical protein